MIHVSFHLIIGFRMHFFHAFMYLFVVLYCATLLTNCRNSIAWIDIMDPYCRHSNYRYAALLVDFPSMKLNNEEDPYMQQQYVTHEAKSKPWIVIKNRPQGQ